MTIWRGRRRRAAVALAQRAGAVALFAVAGLAVPAAAGTDEGGANDSRDVGVRLDLKTVTHAQDGPSIVYTAETHSPFSDQLAVFKWGVDRDLDEAFDLIVFTEWRDGKLVGGVKDPAGRQIAPASVSRPGPTAIRVSFPAEVLGDASVYRYAVNAEAAPGERDLAPNSGLVQHRLGAGPLTSGPRVASSSPPAEASSTAAEPAPTAAEAAPPPSSAAQENLPRTGSADRRLLLALAGAAFAIGGALIGMRGAR